MSDKVSIILPTRNRRGFLHQALRSARAQTWKNIEIIVVDEASTDGTAAMVAAEFPEARFVRNDPPRGPGGVFDMARQLSGGPQTFDEPAFTVKGANITPDRETGIGAWSEADIKRALQDGRRPNGTQLAPAILAPGARRPAAIGVADRTLPGEE